MLICPPLCNRWIVAFSLFPVGFLRLSRRVPSSQTTRYDFQDCMAYFLPLMRAASLYHLSEALRQGVNPASYPLRLTWSITTKSRRVESCLRVTGTRKPSFREQSVPNFVLNSSEIPIGKLDFISSLVMKLIWLIYKRAPEGDFRNWEAIQSWAASLRPMFAETNQEGKQ